jgi:anti-sigma factor RsiW
MNCPLQKPETADILLDYSAGRLDAVRVTGLERHMATCSRCAAFRLEQAAVWDALDSWRPAPVSTDFNRRLWHRIDAANVPWYRALAGSLPYSIWKPAIPLAAAIVVLATGFLVDHPGAKVAPVPGVSVSMTEADQVEQTLDDIQLLHQLDVATAPNDGASKRM